MLSLARFYFVSWQPHLPDKPFKTKIVRKIDAVQDVPYVITVPVPSGTHVIVRAAAIDCLGSVGVCSAGKTTP